MKAIVLTRYGGPEALALREVSTPEPRDDEVLVRVHAASVNAADAHVMRGDPWPLRLMTGWPGPKQPIFGADVAGTVERVGKDVTTLGEGDAVFGDITVMGRGGFAEYAAAPARLLAPKPARVPFDEAAALGMAATTALQAARDWVPVHEGARVLVNGASGGVGHFLVQIAKARGAQVTAVCRTRNVEALHRLGADHVIDYTRQDFRDGGPRYDIVFDAAATRSVKDTARALAPGGTLGFIGGTNRNTFQALLLGRALVRGQGRRCVVHVAKENGDDLRETAALADAGKLRAVVDARYPLSQTADAMRAFEKGGRGVGKIVVTP